MENLGIDSKLLIAQLINFALFFFIFKKYLARPFLKFINDEKQNTEDKEKLLVKAKAMEEKLKENEKTMKAALKKESDAQIQEAKESAQKIRSNCLKRHRQRLKT